ncbi:hypothetical protein A3770_06p43190 [Chloropicon primus]|uniref:V-SNARE coiled-coil homology domain-containing protein n=1 Tax=Chloropicon primus TaxID=1764295 RepID=A0A5B8MND0_9CHLO|nr:hypothetical protein A3770_06p43190 [Chloropicon primus]|eukprot:QDZ21801.1 hypothetical protein A3770_06p43190 [Chloropicon primus]
MKIDDTVSRVLASGNLTSGQRLSITVDKVIGTLHILTNSSDAVLGVFSEAVPRRSAFEVLESTSAFVKDQVTPDLLAGATKEGDLDRFCKEKFRDICTKHRNLGSDKMSKIGVKIEEVKMVVEQNINRVLQNAEDLEAVETKSEILRQDAQQFQRRGENIKRALWWRNFKLKCTIGLLIAVVLCYIFIPIISKQM